MDDLISRAEAMTELQMCAERYIFSHEADGFGTVEWCENLIPVRKAMEILRNLPTVDAVPVRHGKWEVTPVYIKCSECGESFMLIPQNYCPHCGARMRDE